MVRWRKEIGQPEEYKFLKSYLLLGRLHDHLWFFLDLCQVYIRCKSQKTQEVKRTGKWGISSAATSTLPSFPTCPIIPSLQLNHHHSVTAYPLWYRFPTTAVDLQYCCYRFVAAAWKRLLTACMVHYQNALYDSRTMVCRGWVANSTVLGYSTCFLSFR